MHRQECVHQGSLPCCRLGPNGLKGAREGAIDQRQCSHSLNQPLERNERGHVCEEVIPRGNGFGFIVWVCVLAEVVGAGGGGPLGLLELMVGLLMGN